MSLYKNQIKLPITEEIGGKIVSLPIHPNLINADVERIISSVNKYAN